MVSLLKTKAVVTIHHAGQGCLMNIILDISKQDNLFVIEDIVQGIIAKYGGNTQGSIWAYEFSLN